MQEKPPLSLDLQIAQRVRQIRADKGLSLEQLAAKSKVSRSMISVIERAESSPTAVVLEKIASGLGVVLVDLFHAPKKPGEPVARAADNPVWRDPQSGYVRRNVSPNLAQSPIQIVEVNFPAKARVAYESVHRASAVHQQVWVTEGAMDVSLGKKTYHLTAGDCLAFTLEQPIMYFNPTSKTAKYVVVIAN
jgi:transcriptional regulator with XRE-family HTH domain